MAAYLPFTKYLFKHEYLFKTKAMLKYFQSIQNGTYLNWLAFFEALFINSKKNHP